LAGDEDLTADRRLIAAQAAGHLEIRAADFACPVACDLAAPRSHASVRVARRRWVDVPLYRAGGPGRPARASRHRLGGGPHGQQDGEPSPLRHLARRPVDRAAVIRRWCAEFGDRHGIEVWCWFRPASGQWELDFERIPGGPSVADVRAAIAAHRYLCEHQDATGVATEVGAAIRRARAMREAGVAVILGLVIRASGCLSDRAAGSPRSRKKQKSRGPGA